VRADDFYTLFGTVGTENLEILLNKKWGTAVIAVPHLDQAELNL
jgi:hypothetical protein